MHGTGTVGNYTFLFLYWFVNGPNRSRKAERTKNVSGVLRRKSHNEMKMLTSITKFVLILLSRLTFYFDFIPGQPTFVTSFSVNQKKLKVDRRQALQDIASCIITVSGTSLCPKDAFAANLPKSTGADLTKTGTVEKLAPIVEMKKSLINVQALLNEIPKSSSLSGDVCNKIHSNLKFIPSTEVNFKRVFDEYSDPVSYRQKFMDQNAFLVYYTKGYDGLDRPKLDVVEMPKQTLQYGLRNDAWTAYDDILVELSFQSDESSKCADVSDAIDKMLKAVDSYVRLGENLKLD